MKQQFKQNIFFITLAGFLLFPLASLGQNPSVGTHFKVLIDSTEINEQSKDNVEVFFRKQNQSNKNQWANQAKTEVPYNSEYKEYQHYEYGSYCEEINEITIIHNTDTMIIRFKMEFSNQLTKKNYPDCLIGGCWLCGIYNFNFEIPFKKGYYEITEIKFESGSPKRDFLWTPLQKEYRKLLINGL